MLSCRETARLIAASKERRLSFKERIQLYLHLRACALCKRFQKQMDLLEESLRRVVGASESKATLPPEAQRRILQKIDESKQ